MDRATPQCAAGLLQWKALLCLLFNCDTAATGAHCDVFAVVLQCLCAQLTFAMPKEGSDGTRGDEGDIGVAAELDVAELMQDSFVRRGATEFLNVLAQEQHRLPRTLWRQVRPTQLRILASLVGGGNHTISFATALPPRTPSQPA